MNMGLKKVILISAAAFVLLAPVSFSRGDETELTPKIGPEALQAMLIGKEKVALINVSSYLECRDEQIPGSSCLACDDFAKSAPSRFPDKEMQVVFYCEHTLCDAPCKALDEAKQMGYVKLSFLAGGMTAWKEAGYGTVSPERITRAPILSVKPQALGASLKAGGMIFFLDARAKELFGRDHLPGAVNIPASEIQDRYQEIPWNREIVVADEDGLSSFLLASYLKSKGFSSVKRLRGGMAAWREHLQ
jgi:rhodanese-related sulfurtransferase